jgi:glycosyltransferase involved in cell wall biosynthesis
MRRLLIIDSSVSGKSPTMRSWLAAAPAVLPQRFDEVEVWGFHCELDEPWVKWRRIKPVTRRWAIQSLFYDLKVRAMMNRTSNRYRSETLIQCTGTHLPKADIRYIQFWNTAYTEAALERPDFLRLPLKDRIVGPLLRRDERRSLLPGRTGEWWCVSRGIAAPIIRDSTVPPVIRYLPNAYDSHRFNQSYRKSMRLEMRAQYHFNENDIVFSFSAFGHFERKGLRQAAQAISILVRKGLPARLLVIGGNPNAIQGFRKQLSALSINPSFITFAGLVDGIERHLSASDAFILPSHFEAFSLAEIEAGALGLRLYLTAHPGHEMILREHRNGRLLPWNPEEMAQILDEEILSGKVREPHSEMGEALDRPEYAAAMANHYDEAIKRKWPPENHAQPKMGREQN